MAIFLHGCGKADPASSIQAAAMADTVFCKGQLVQQMGNGGYPQFYTYNFEVALPSCTFKSATYYPPNGITQTFAISSDGKSADNGYYAISGCTESSITAAVNGQTVIVSKTSANCGAVP